MLEGLSPELVWGLFPRFVGFVYVLGFASLLPQTRLLGGERGILPVQKVLGRVRRDYPGLRRFLEYPTVLWWLRTDGSLRLVCGLGLVSGALAIYGGPLGYAGLAVALVCWLSLELLGLTFPWDTMLSEVGFLSLFLPLVHPLPEVTAAHAPLPTVAFMARWLLLRIMWGFGKDKFIGVRSDDALYLRGFFVWMPLPNPLGWFAHHAPAFVLKAGHLFMFFAEIIAPFLGLIPGPTRVLAYGALVALMLGIQATGNWGFFNVGYALLCICLLDVHAALWDMAGRSWWLWPEAGIHLVMACLFLASLFYLPLNSWFTRSWVHWPPNYAAWSKLEKRLRSARWLLALAPAPLRLLASFRFVNGYGVFPPNSSPPVRLVPVLEGSEDGVSWKPYGYRYMPTFADSAPCVASPGHPRIEFLTTYVANGIHHGGLVASAFPYGSPYLGHARASTFDVLMQRLMENDPHAVGSMGHNPFPDRPPQRMRISCFAMTPTRPRERHETGCWWHTRRLGLLASPRGKATWPERLLLPEPECFHPDYVEHRRRSPVLRGMVRAHQAGVAPDRAILADGALEEEEVAAFWGVLGPMLRHQRGDWTALSGRARAVSERFGVEPLYRQERALERFVWLLRCRIEAHPEAGPQLRALSVSNFRLHMILHEIVADGRDAYLEMLADPTGLARRAANTTDATQLWVLALLRYEQMMQQICAFRWSELGLRVHENELPGLFEYYPFLHSHVPDREEFCPEPIKHADGDHTIPGFYPPSEVTPSSVPQKGEC